jgi:DNA-binding NarL/FixJ family response regulator
MKVLIADDHALFREGLRHVLDALGRTLDILEAADGQQTLALVEQHPDLDLLLLDLAMPGMHGFTALDVLGKRYPALPVVILSASSLAGDMQRALDKGAMGFIPKCSTGAVMIGALQLVLTGSVYIPTEIFTHTVNVNRALLDTGLEKKLTPRQRDVLALMQRGQPNKLIAVRLGLAEATVKMHVSAILKALAVTNRTQAVVAMEKSALALSTANAAWNDDVSARCG